MCEQGYKPGSVLNGHLSWYAVTGTENIARNMPWRHTDVYLNFCACLPDAAAMSTKDMSERTQELLTAAMGND